MAATERSQENKYPDPTAAIGMAKTKQGRYILFGNYHKDTFDDELNISGQFCKRSGARDMQIIAQGQFDGRETHVVLPVDPAAAGKTAFQQMAKTLMAEGLIVKKDPAPSNKAKLLRFEPFATACVKMVW